MPPECTTSANTRTTSWRLRRMEGGCSQLVFSIFNPPTTLPPVLHLLLFRFSFFTPCFISLIILDKGRRKTNLVHCIVMGFCVFLFVGSIQALFDYKVTILLRPRWLFDTMLVILFCMDLVVYFRVLAV